MSINFEELDYQKTELGELILRRRRMLSLEGAEVFDIKLGGRVEDPYRIVPAAQATEAQKRLYRDWLGG